MADGYTISINLGNLKKDITVADTAVGTAGIEILVDHTKFKTQKEVADALTMAAELVLESNQPMA